MITHNVDRQLAFAFLWLAIFGIAMISSVSVYQSFLLTTQQVKTWLWTEVSNNFYFIRSLLYFWLGLVVFFITTRTHYSIWKRIAPTMFLITIFLLVLVFIPWLTNDYWSSRSWLNIPFLPSIQPAEIMKIALIFYFALWLESKSNKIATFKEWFLPFAIIMAIIVWLLWAQPDFWSVLVITMISWSMFFIWGWNLFHIFWSWLIWVLIATPVIMTHEYIKKRFVAFLNPDFDLWWAWYQIKQALITIWSWEIFGVWFGKSIQKFWYLPEVQWDTIFAIISEELWFVRVLLLVACYVFIAYKWFKIANRAPDRFSMLLATWITAFLVFQAFINISVNIAIMPLTGLTLPFISYWWSSFVMTMFAAWILLSISRHTVK